MSVTVLHLDKNHPIVCDNSELILAMSCQDYQQQSTQLLSAYIWYNLVTAVWRAMARCLYVCPPGPTMRRTRTLER